MTTAAELAIHEQLRALVQRSGKLQREVAEAAGMAPSQLADILAGRSQPRLDTACRIAEACGHDLKVSFPRALA